MVKKALKKQLDFLCLLRIVEQEAVNSLIDLLTDCYCLQLLFCGSPEQKNEHQKEETAIDESWSAIEISGLYYYGARYYDPWLGRFISPDTVLAGLNRYAYCGNNPVRYVDPTGHVWYDASGTRSSNDHGQALSEEDFEIYKEVFSPASLGSINYNRKYTIDYGKINIESANSNGPSNEGMSPGSTDDDLSNIAKKLYEGGLDPNGTGIGDGEIFMDAHHFSEYASDRMFREASYCWNHSNPFGFLWYSIAGWGYDIVEAFTPGTYEEVLASANVGIISMNYNALKTAAMNSWIDDAMNISDDAGRGAYTVYQGINAAGKVQYVGITRREALLRWAEHLRAYGTGKELLKYFKVPGTGNLLYREARILEQQLINKYGLDNLLNWINSIAETKWAQYGIVK